jgi:hypothetical protein
MITVKLLELYLKYLDALDKTLSKQLEHKKPPGEEALTSMLCSLLDSDEQKSYNLEYYHDDFIADLKKEYRGVKFDFSIRTNEHNKAYEGVISQADLGLIITYVNHYSRKDSWTESWLFQAKALKPSSINPLEYGRGSKFDATSTNQMTKINKLTDRYGSDFFRFLMYCPRLTSSYIENNYQGKLKYLRDVRLSKDIFDYQWSLALYTQFSSQSDRFIDGGIIVSMKDDIPKDLQAIYQVGYLEKNLPFSWFIVERFLSKRSGRKDGNRIQSADISSSTYNVAINENDNRTITHGLARGDEDAIKIIEEELQIGRREYSISPSRTLQVSIEVGGDQ